MNYVNFIQSSSKINWNLTLCVPINDVSQKWESSIFLLDVF